MSSCEHMLCLRAGESAHCAFWVFFAIFLSLKGLDYQVFRKIIVGMSHVPEEMDSGTEVLPGLRIKADGTVVRNSDRALPTTDTTVNPDPIFVANVASKDVVVDSETGIWGRVFLPESVTDNKKLPIVVYFHGGGFCMGNAGGESPTYQVTRLCKTANVVVISASYRLAPESRLPIAFIDAYTTMSWLQKQCKYQASGDESGDPWLMNNVDFSRVFVVGLSAGGNIAHHVVVGKPLEDFYPLRIAGVIPLVPFFSAEEVSESERQFPEDDVLPLVKHHAFWRLALPEGATRDHPFCNPLSADAPNLAHVTNFPRVLLIVAGKDPLYTRQLQYWNALKQAGKDVQLIQVPEGSHVFRKSAALEAENVRVDKAISDFIHNSHLS